MESRKNWISRTETFVALSEFSFALYLVFFRQDARSSYRQLINSSTFSENSRQNRTLQMSCTGNARAWKWSRYSYAATQPDIERYSVNRDGTVAEQDSVESTSSVFFSFFILDGRKHSRLVQPGTVNRNEFIGYAIREHCIRIKKTDFFNCYAHAHVVRNFWKIMSLKTHIQYFVGQWTARSWLTEGLPVF